MSKSRYEIEVWSKSGILLGDIRHLASGLKWTKQRNSHETVEFTMDLARYESFLASIGFSDNPFSFMEVLSTDIRIKREGQYLIGANVIKIGYSPSDPSVTMKVSCTGYLNYFKDQYLDIAYTNTPQGNILWGVIQQVQAKAGANFGITQGSSTSTSVNRDRNVSRKNVKDFMQQMTNVIGGCDFEFTHDKKFNTYDVMGSYRPDIRLVYPENVESFSFERRGDVLYNYIYGIGSGNGEDAIQTHTESLTSRDEYYRREKISTYNSVEQVETLLENIEGVLEMSKDPRELPSFSVHDGVLDLNDVNVGDSIYVRLDGFKSMQHINGYYRIEKIECSVDDNDAESVSLTFDDLNIDDIISSQEG